MFEQIARMLNDTAQHLKSQQTKSGFLPQRKKELSHERKEYSQQKKELSQQKKECSQQIHGRKDRSDCNSTIKDSNNCHDRRQDEQKKWDNRDDKKNLPSSLLSPITEKSKECGDIMSVVNREEYSFQPFIDNNFGNSYDSDSFYSLVLDCYSGLSSSLLKVAEKIAVAIRKIEIENNMKYSILDLSQRKGDDFKDLLGSLFISSIKPKNDIKLKLELKLKSGKYKVKIILRKLYPHVENFIDMKCISNVSVILLHLFQFLVECYFSFYL